MWVVENTGKFISGIFSHSETTKLNKYLAKTRKAGKDDGQKTYLVSVPNYPLFILEFKKANKKTAFSFFDSEESARKSYEDLKLKNAILYTIKKDFEPEDPGTDFMGVLDHDHLGEE